MDDKILDVEGLKSLFNYGLINLSNNYKTINDLNVFPVPDGDTGTNMRITLANGIDAIKDCTDFKDLFSKFSTGVLFGARGNSGVLLSQYFKGFSKALEEKKEITTLDFKHAMISGCKQAYTACVDPTEGTILTVAREGIENIKNNINENTTYTDLLGMVVDSMKVSLDNTPNLLPVLKDAGVIDSGGKGLLTIFEGFFKFFTGEELNTDDELEGHSSKTTTIDYSLFNENSTLDYGYCTEFLLQLLVSKIDINSFNLQDFISFLNDHGNSIVCFQNGTIVKVHIHTKKPYEVIEFAQRFGEFVTFKMENMALQHNEVIRNESVRKEGRIERAIIGIVNGAGLVQVFKDLGCLSVIKAVNDDVSTSEIIDALKQVNANKVIIVPDSKRSFEAAKQVESFYKDCEVKPVETTSIQQAYGALSLVMLTENDSMEILHTIEEHKDKVLSASITLNNNKYVGKIEDEEVVSDDTLVSSACSLIRSIPDIDDKEVMFIIYGKGVKEEDLNQIIETMSDEYPFLEIGLIDGKQEDSQLLIGLHI